MFKIQLKNGNFFECDSNSTIFEGAKKQGIILEHSCLSARCRSCIAHMSNGKTMDVLDDLILTKEEKEEGYILSCNTRPLSDIRLDVDDLGDIHIPTSRTIPSKIDEIELISDKILKLTLRFPPNSNYNFLPGQYVNIIKGNIRRSYSIGNTMNSDSRLHFYIKKYENGLMSDYLFNNAKKNDLLRIEGPLGTFFLRNSTNKTIVFLATGTGIAPVKAMVEQLKLNKSFAKNKKVWVVWGARFRKDLFWHPNIQDENFSFIPVLSRENKDWAGEKGYVQDVLLMKIKDFNYTEVYACGSIEMIDSSRKLLVEKGLPEGRFYSDAFVSSN